jgi:UTP:GlnB (protein PII) uridylyltransferase
MSIDPGQRAYRLVEELRAEVDFEIDDVISEIVRSLPEEYFLLLAHDDQLTHLKALLAISICHLRDRITLRSDNGRQVAVVARQNYPGMLARIIADLPTDQTLIGAKVFTSKSHDFIIDLFDFQSDTENGSPNSISHLELADLITEVSQQTGVSEGRVRPFIEMYPQGNQAFESAADIVGHFRAFELARETGETVVCWQHENHAKVTIASASASARDLFLASAKSLSNLHADIDQAFLYDFPLPDKAGHIAVASFAVLGDFAMDAPHYEAYLRDCLVEA